MQGFSSTQAMPETATLDSFTIHSSLVEIADRSMQPEVRSAIPAAEISHQRMSHFMNMPRVARQAEWCVEGRTLRTFHPRAVGCIPDAPPVKRRHARTRRNGASRDAPYALRTIAEAPPIP